MTNDEAKAAWRDQAPVVLNGIVYTVRSLIYRYPKTLLAELMDKNNRCVVITQPDKTEVQDHGTADD